MCESYAVFSTSLNDFVPAFGDDIAICASGNALGFGELANNLRWLVAFLDLCQLVAIERESGGDLLLVQSVQLRFDAELELDDGRLEGGLGGEAELIAVFCEEDSWRDLIANLSQEEADACNCISKRNEEKNLLFINSLNESS